MTKIDIFHEIQLQSDAEKRPMLDVMLDHLVACKKIITSGSVPDSVKGYARADMALLNSKMGIVVDSTSYDEDRRYR